MEEKCLNCKAKATYLVYDKYMTHAFHTCEEHIDEIINNKIGVRHTIHVKKIK
jgi:hypothetical protein